MVTTYQKVGYPRLGFSDKRDLNSGKTWSEMDVRDLNSSVAYGDTIDETACHLCRSIKETKAKLKELGLEIRRKPARAPKKTLTAEKPDDATHRWKGRLVPDRVAKKSKDSQ
jgi:hypothetical protein